MPADRIPSATIEKIRGRVDLVRLVEEAGVALRRSGKNYLGKCPFHQDDTPSFSVSPERQLYHCFGCGASGTAFTFVQRRETLSYDEAVRKLAARVGVVIETDKSRAAPPEEAFLPAANRFAREFYHEALMRSDAGRRARNYLAERGLSEETIREFQLGYAPDGWDALLSVMKRNGFAEETLLKAGLVRERESGGYYDYFRNRVIFPILNAQGEVVAFGGRALDDSKPKYLNSPDTPLYKKSDVLFFLHPARPAIQQEGRVLITEGYLDAISVYQAGIRNAVASLGTALSESHARLLRRYTDEAIFLFDSDSAGSRAVARGAPIFLTEGFRVKIALMPAGHDPDSYVREQGADALRRCVSEAVNLVEFQIRSLAKEKDMTEGETKLECIREVADILRHIPHPVLLQDYAGMLANELDLHVKDVWVELRRQGVLLRTPPPRESVAREARRKPRIEIERQLLTYLLAEPKHVLTVFEQLTPADFLEPRHQELARILWLSARDSGDADSYLLMETCYDEEIRGLMAELLLKARQLPDVIATIQGCVAKITRDTLREVERKRLEQHAKEGTTDELAIAQELLELSRQRREYERK